MIMTTSNHEPQYTVPYAVLGSIKVSEKLPTYPSLKPTSSLSSHLGQNVGLGEG